MTLLNDGGDPTGVYGEPQAGLWYGVVITNDSSEPIQRCRVRATLQGRRFGPQLLGLVRPGTDVTYQGRTDLDEDGAPDADAEARFYDARGRPWIRTARGELRPAGDDLLQWMPSDPEASAGPV